MISWIPLLGKEGLINMALIKVGVIHEPLELLLFSGFSVVVAYVHQLTIFMIVPIFNSMGRIDKRVVEAALDAGASRFDIMRYIILPLSKNGIALGTIFVVSIVMGDFFVIKVMSGGGSASVVGALHEDVGVLQYPTAAASAVVLTILVTLIVTPSCARSTCARRSPDERGAGIAGGRSTCDRAARRRPALDVLRAAHGLRSLCARTLWADDLHLHSVVPGCARRPRLPDEGAVTALVRRPVHAGPHRRREGLVRPVVVSFLAGLAFRRRFHGDGVVFYLMIGSLVAPGLVLSIGIGLLLNFVGIQAAWYTGRRATLLDLAVWRAGHVRGDVALRPR